MAKPTKPRDSAYTFGHEAPVLKSHFSRTVDNCAAYLIPHITEDAKILDVGCGPGTITCGLAALAAKGSVVGLDNSSEVIKEAGNHAAAKNISNIKFVTGDAKALPFPDASFDIVHAHITLMHVPDAKEVVREMRRVCRDGGIVAIREGIWETTIMYPKTKGLELWKEAHGKLIVASGADPNGGGKLCTWALEVGFSRDKINISASTLIYAQPEERLWWGQLTAERIEKASSSRKLVEEGLATEDDVQEMIKAWKGWRDSEDSIWGFLCVQMLCWK